MTVVCSINTGLYVLGGMSSDIFLKKGLYTNRSEKQVWFFDIYKVITEIEYYHPESVFACLKKFYHDNLPIINSKIHFAKLETFSKSNLIKKNRMFAIGNKTSAMLLLEVKTTQQF